MDFCQLYQWHKSKIANEPIFIVAAAGKKEDFIEMISICLDDLFQISRNENNNRSFSTLVA